MSESDYKVPWLIADPVNRDNHMEKEFRGPQTEF